MVRGKKREKELTLKEKLQEALVPEDEHPYEVPENWCWVVLEAVCNGFQYGYTEKASYDKIGPHFIRITDIGNGIIDDTSAPYCIISDNDYTKYRIHKGDIFIARMGSVGENGLALNDIDGVFASYLIRLVPRISPVFVRDFLQSPMYWRQITDKSQGTTRLNVNANVLRKLLFPLPPLPEQQRIVNRIERLFAKLDEAKEKAQAVVDGFEDRKAAILHKAFMGEYTKKWRWKHHISFEDTWTEKKVVDLCSLIVDCPHSTPKWTKAGKICLRTTNIKDGYLDFSQTKYVSEQTFIERIQRAIPQAGDVLLTREGNIGDVGVIPEGVEICLGQRMMLLRPDECESNFLVYFFRSPHVTAMIKSNTMGSTAPRMNIKDIKQISMLCPSYEEQKVITCILDYLMQFEQQAKDVAEKVIDQIDTMKKAILARAFRGELGTNNSTDESVEELLKTIM